MNFKEHWKKRDWVYYLTLFGVFAVAFFLSPLLIDGRTADPYGPKALRASMGAVFRVPVYAGNLPEMLERIGDTHDLYAGALDGEPYFERVRSHPGVCVIIGNEGAGISQAVYGVSGLKKVKLPMVGGAESLNASVAGAIMIYDIVRRGE